MKALFIIAPTDFRDEELFEPKKLLEENGIETAVASLNTDTAIGVMKGEQKVDLDISEVKIDDYDAIIFIGGPGARIYFENETAIKLAKNADAKGKIIGAICIAPVILANAGILSEKSVTCWPGDSEQVERGGAKYEEGEVIVDGKIITASGPKAAHKFGEEILKALKA